MGINKPSDLVADLQVGPTTEGMVRIYVRGEGIDLPMDFSPDEAADIAQELLDSADMARKGTSKKK